MEPWKIGVIIALIVGLGGYQYYRENAPPPPPPAPANQDPELKQRVTGFSQMEGQPAPAWNIEPKLWANTPKPINLSDLKGSVTLLEFWRTGCSHCIEAAPFMQKQIFEKFTPNGLKMVTFHSPGKNTDATEQDWTQVQAKIRELGIKYPVAFDTDSQVFRGKYNGFSYPSIILLDRDGIIRYVQDGHTPEKAAALTKKLHEMLGLKQPSPPAGAPSTPGTSSSATGATGATKVDPHAGHNHPPGVEHEPEVVDPHAGHNHPPGVTH